MWEMSRRANELQYAVCSGRLYMVQKRQTAGRIGQWQNQEKLLIGSGQDFDGCSPNSWGRDQGWGEGIEVRRCRMGSANPKEIWDCWNKSGNEGSGELRVLRAVLRSLDFNPEDS